MTSPRHISLLLIAAALAACTPETEPGFYEFTLEASALDADTRTSYENDRTFSWCASDKISVLFHNGSTDKFFMLESQGSGPSVKFKGSIENGYTLGSSDGKKWALYPAADHTYTDGTVNFQQPATVDFASNGFSANIPLYALGTDKDEYVFRPMCSVAKFTFTGIEASTVSLKVTNQSKHALSGLFPCRESESTLFWWPQSVSAGSPDLSLTFIEKPQEGTAVFYVPFPGWDAAGFIPALELKDSGSGDVLYSATAKQGFPSESTSSLGRIIKVPAIDCNVPVSSFTTVTYTESTANFANPERGFYMPKGIRSESASTITNSWMSSQRKAGRSLALLEYYLMDYMESDISAKYLTVVENNFKALRKGGMKCILRFTYSDTSSGDGPWDATEEWVMRHIQQIKPLLQAYSDVIYVMQAGFIGAWGEWYYTTNFVFKPSSSADYQPRKRVLEALLDALPSNRQVEVRTPTFKMKIFNLALKDTITRATAHTDSPVSRVAGHNDCFVASGSDQGTFQNSTERNYWKADTRYTIMGGETCAVSDYCHCQGSGSIPGTLSELASYHWSYLNIDYNKDVLNLWDSEGCKSEVEQRLGYRLVLQDGTFTSSPRAGKDMEIELRLKNKGFAAPMNPRGAYLVLTDASSNELVRWPLDSDPRFWQPESGTITVNKTVTIPAGVSGTAKLHLFLPDGSATLADNPLYAIRMANDDMWDETTGFNLLYTFNIAQ